MRTIVDQLSSLLQAYGYRAEAGREHVVFEDVGALARVTQTIVGGRAQAITAEDVGGNQPNFVVVEDNPPSGQLERLIALSRQTTSLPQVLSFSRFVDKLWRADLAAQWARGDSEAGEDTSLPAGMTRPARPHPLDQYADQTLTTDNGESRKAFNYVLDWLQGKDNFLVILAEAGLGKSELTRVLQWHAATNYANQSSKEVGTGLPSALLRVRLRDLDALTLDAITDYLRAVVGLDRIPNAQVLAHLMCYGRLTLLLDGLDELDVPRSEIAYGLEELQQVSDDGAQILLTSRSGFARAEAPIRTALRSAKIANLESLSEDGAIEMLQKYGAMTTDARAVYRALPERIRGVPLFLLWGHLSGHHSAPDKNRAETLLDMIQQFCIREQRRLLLPAAEQMKLLSEIAYYSTSGSISADDGIILSGDEDSRFVHGPHSLLQLDSSKGLQFRYAPFAELFLARGVETNWRESEHADQVRFRSWLQDRLGDRALQDLTCEYLADLLEDGALSTAWKVASEAPLRYQPWLRRNVLAIALQVIGNAAESKDPVRRSDQLYARLGNRDLAECVLTGLTFEMFDFRSWDLRGVMGNGASFAFCRFDGAFVDDGVQSARLESCTGLSVQLPEEEVLRRGRHTLERALRPFRNRAVSDHALHPRIAADTPGIDRRAMDVLKRRGFLIKEPRERGNISLVLTDVGKLELQRYLEKPNEKASEDLSVVLHDLAK